MPIGEITELNERQQSAVLHKDGPLLIVAGAGAGKTRVITHRIAKLIENGIAPEHILAVTFTNKAAREMRERVLALLASSGERRMPFVATFHALGVAILREHSSVLGLSRWFAIYDRGDSISVIRRILKSLGYDPKQFDPKSVLGAISREKGEGRSYQEFAGVIQDFYGQLVSDVWQHYEQELSKEHALDFDDLLLKTVGLFKKYPEILSKYQTHWQYIHVDEYQDTNAIQYELSRLLAEKHHNICVVGDMDQNIYSWRGARHEHMTRFEKNFEGTTVVLLEQNYRSTKTILDAANAIIKKNKVRKEKNLFTVRADGEKITIYPAFDERDEASFITTISGQLIEGGLPAEEIAVLYRANFQSRVIEEAMLRAGIPYQVVGTAFFERREVKEILAFVRASLNPADRASVERIIGVGRKGFGDKTMEKIFSGDTATLPPKVTVAFAEFKKLLANIREVVETRLPSDAMKSAYRLSRLEEYYSIGREDGEERIENIKELVSLAGKYDSLGPRIGIEKMLEEAALMSDQDSLGAKGSGVRLMTVHAAKGLEFAHVFVAGLEQGLFPHERLDPDQATDPEEERRLMYVAVTRAKEKLYLSYTTTRTVFGTTRVNIPSEFLDDIPPGLTDQANPYQPSEDGSTNFLGNIIDF